MISQMQALEEAALSPEHAKEYAATLGGRKFRLEASRAGNSRFVYRSTAQRMKWRYGGTVVNYRPRKPSMHVVAAKGLGPCPDCDAGSHQACMTAGGYRWAPHKERV